MIIELFEEIQKYLSFKNQFDLLLMNKFCFHNLKIKNIYIDSESKFKKINDETLNQKIYRNPQIFVNYKYPIKDNYCRIFYRMHNDKILYKFSRIFDFKRCNIKCISKFGTWICNEDYDKINKCEDQNLNDNRSYLKSYYNILYKQLNGKIYLNIIDYSSSLCNLPKKNYSFNYFVAQNEIWYDTSQLFIK